MTEFWNFYSEHWFVGTIALIFILLALQGAIGLAFRLCNRVLRTVKVCVRGWPPAHIDADGDWKPESE